MTATRRPRTGQVMTIPHRVLRAFRHVNDELMRASEAIIRSARAPQPHPQIQAPAARDTHPGTAPIVLTGPPDPHARAFPPVMTAPAD